MSARWYRPTVIACALSWFMVGLHLPALHAMTHHGGTPAPVVLAATALLAVVGIAGLWALLRVRAS